MDTAAASKPATAGCARVFAVRDPREGLSPYTPASVCSCYLRDDELLSALKGDDFVTQLGDKMSSLAETDREALFPKRAGWNKFILEAGRRMPKWPVDTRIAQALLLKYLEYEGMQPVSLWMLYLLL